MKGFLLILFLLLSYQAFACSCFGPNNFTEELKANQIIFKGKVIKVIKQPEALKQTAFFFSYTVIKVEHWYQNDLQVDTLLYGNGSTSACQTNIEGYPIGTELILKTTLEKNLTSYNSSIYEKENNPDNAIDLQSILPNYPIVEYHVCDPGILEVKDNKVIGNITKQKKNFKPQQIKFCRFNRIMRRKMYYLK